MTILIQSAIRLFDAMKIEEYQLSIDVHNLIILACNTPKYLPFGLELIRRMKVLKQTIIYNRIIKLINND